MAHGSSDRLDHFLARLKRNCLIGNKSSDGEGCGKGNHGSDLLNRRPVTESLRAYRLLFIALPRRLIH